MDRTKGRSLGVGQLVRTPSIPSLVHLGGGGGGGRGGGFGTLARLFKDVIENTGLFACLSFVGLLVWFCCCCCCCFVLFFAVVVVCLFVCFFGLFLVCFFFVFWGFFVLFCFVFFGGGGGLGFFCLPACFPVVLFYVV